MWSLADCLRTNFLLGEGTRMEDTVPRDGESDLVLDLVQTRRREAREDVVINYF